MYVRNLDGEEFPIQVNVNQNYKLNSNIKLSASILPTKVNKPFIEDIGQLWKIFDHDDVEHTILYAKRKGKGKLMTVDIQAIPLFFDVLDTNRIYGEYNEHMTAYVAFSRIFEDLPFNFVLVDTFYAVDWEGFGAGETKLETFKRALNRYGAEFRIVGDTVYLESLIGRDTQFQYRYKLNASNITEEVDGGEMWTYAVGYGDYEDGEESENGGWQNAALFREYKSPIADIASIGFRHGPPIKNGNIKTNDFMDEQLKTLVDESLKISVSADIHDLRKQGYPLAQPQLGDRVFLIDERIGFDEEVRVVDISITKNWKGEITKLTLTFGTPGMSERHQSEINTASKMITEVFENRRKIPFSAYDSAVQQATRDLKNAKSEVTFPETGGILTIDRDDPNMITLLNSKGFGVSDDGGGTFNTAVTGEGVIGETIIGKILIGQSLLIENESSTFVVDGEGVTIDGGAVSIGGGGLKESNIASAEKWNNQGTYINEDGVYTGLVSAEQVRVGFNNIGDDMHLTSNSLDMYSDSELTSSLTRKGQTFHRDGYEVGYVGSIHWHDDPSYRGLGFNLDENASFMTWGHDDDADGVYTSKFVWHKNNRVGNKGFTFSDEVTVTDKFKVGSRAEIESGANSARLKVSDNVWLYVNENGQVGINYFGTAHLIHNVN